MQMPKAATVEVADFYLSAVDGEAPQENKDYAYSGNYVVICSENPMVIHKI